MNPEQREDSGKWTYELRKALPGTWAGKMTLWILLMPKTLTMAESSSATDEMISEVQSLPP